MSEVCRRRFRLSFPRFAKRPRNFRIYGRWIRRFGVVSSVGLLTLAAFTIVPVVRGTDDVEGAPKEPAASVLAITTGRPSADLDLSVTSSSGTFAMTDDDHSAKFGVYTTNYSGYTLTVAATDSSRQLANVVGVNTVDTIDSISSTISASTFENGSAATYNNKWGYKPSMYNSAANTNFMQAPTTTAQTLNVTSCANGSTSCPTEIDNYSIAIGARADYTKLGGLYTDTFVLSIVANPINYTVQFRDNSGDTSVSGLPSSVSGSTSSAVSINLPSAAPTRTGYTFKAWCYGEVSDRGVTCNGAEYAAGTPYPISQNDSPTIMLYALWYISMQDIDYGICSTTPKIAVDNRDGQKYTIQKLEDGRCWMMDNLNLGATDISVDLDGDNTNFSSNIITAATFNSWRKTEATAQNYNDGVMFHVDGTDPVAKSDYGMLYNYYAATGGIVLTNSNVVPVEYDICPKGWRMPTTGAATDEYNNLFTLSGTTVLERYNNFRKPVAEGGKGYALSGRFTTALPTGIDGYTEYWGPKQGSTTSETSYAALYRLSWRLNPNNGSGGGASANIARNVGNPMRCILRPTINDVPSMQEFNTLKSEDRRSVINSMAENTNYTLIDNRDGQEYTVAKLKDGRVWMTQNLDLGITNIPVAFAAANTNSSTATAVATFNGWRKTAFTPSYTAGEFVYVEGEDSTAKSKYGTLYNFYVVSNSTIKVASSVVDATQDICPAGWRLPSGGPLGELTTLYTAYGSSGANLRKPVSEGGAGFALAGTSISSGQGSVGNFWTASRGGNAGMIAMSFNENTVTPNAIYDRGSGGSIRCILKSNIGDFNTLQELKNMRSKQRADIIAYMPGRNIIYTLKDDRDGTYYTVTKYYDNTIWMTQDLKLGVKTLSKNLDSSNTNIDSTIPYNTVNGWRTTSTDATYTAGRIYYNSAGAIDSVSKSEYGALYNYYAATAGTITGSSNNTDASYDICPAGWRMPVGGNNAGEFKTLYANSAYASLAAMKNPIFAGGAAFSLTGDGSSGSQGTNVFYWTATSNSNATTRSGMAITTAVAVNSNADRGTLHPIRCTLKFQADTMQEFATLAAVIKSDVLYSMVPGVNYDIVDNRDNQLYTMAKMKDGKVWMSKNLALGAQAMETDLTSANTNLSTARTAAVFNGWKKTTGTTSLTAGEFIVTANGEVLYNFAAASTLTIAAASATGNASYDLCPAGWKLPTGNTTGEQGLLYNQYNSATLMTNSIANGGAAYTLPGYTTGTSVTNAGTAGRYWSATVNTATGRYIIDLSSTSVSLTTVGTRSHHYSIHCIMK